MRKSQCKILYKTAHTLKKIKMKQGVLIIANKQKEQLLDLLSSFNDDFFFFIHIDKKSELEVSDFEHLPNVCFVAKIIRVNWGGMSLIECTNLLMQEYVKHSELEYAHLISGSDYPIKDCEYISNYLEENKDSEFFEYAKLPIEFYGGYDRLLYYYFMDRFNVRTTLGRYLAYGLVRIQKTFHFKKNLQDGGLGSYYFGSQWWTLSTAAIQYLLQFQKNNPRTVHFFKYSYIPDEMYFQSILMNSPFEKKCAKNNLRYYDWSHRDDKEERPLVLDERDFRVLKESKAFFARKIVQPQSNALVRRINNEIRKISQ